MYHFYDYISMSDIINILPDSVANQIAAGEVIDRPASAVKELLENAVDAGAKHIQLIVKDAGRTLIQVIDDGCGMSENDARLCFERHATSKIKRAGDLFALHTMGFRGEALASIAAVAQVELRTRQHGAEWGTLIELENGEVVSQQACTCDEGTNLMMKNLFCSIPARRNFLKKESIELAHIEEVFRRVALVYNEIDFTFHSNGKLLYNLKGGNLAQRIVALFGENYRQRLYSVDEDSDVVEVHGYICKPEYVRRSRGEQYLFVNDRFIKHANLSSAVERAYDDLIPEHSFPGYFLKLKVKPNRIDVNIHPTKTEVRFTDEHAISAILRAATKRALGQFALGGEIDFDHNTAFDIPAGKKDTVPQAPTVSFNPNYNPFQNLTPKTESTGTKGFSTGRTSPIAGLQPHRSEWEEDYTPVDKNSSSSPILTDHPAETILPTAATGKLFDTSTTDNNNSPSAGTDNILLFNKRYLVATLSSGLLIVDIQRAQERIVYDRLLRQAQNSQHGGAQQLLFPVTCTFSVAEAEILKSLVPELQKMGFELSPVGITGFVVSATPSDIDYNELQDLLYRMITDFKSDNFSRLDNRKQRLCLALARQIALRCNPATLKPIELQSLLAALFSCQVPNVTPSGKKTLMIMKHEEIDEKMK